MIDGSEKRKHQLAFELQSSRVFEKRSNSTPRGESSLSKGILFFDVNVSRLRVVPHLSSGIVERAKREHA